MKIGLKRLVTILVTAAIVVVPFVAIWQRQAIFDWWQLRNYVPSSQISALAKRTTLTEYGQHLFYVYHAQLQDKEAFNNSCTFSEKSIVLGCYVDGEGIYIFNVTDERLNGVQEVTAAHEVLHAGYQRLSSSERERIDELTQQVLNGVTNKRILDSVEAYRDRDPLIVPNELHSIIGTEVSDIPEELETYYKQYFADRQAVVAYAISYEKAFTEREQRAQQIISQIETAKSDIDELNNRLSRTKSELQQEFAALQSQRSTAEAESFNARVRSYNAKVQTYNADVQYSYTLIDRHNALVAEYNSVVLEEKELIKAIDSRPETIDPQ